MFWPVWPWRARALTIVQPMRSKLNHAADIGPGACCQVGSSTIVSRNTETSAAPIVPYEACVLDHHR
eukprot:6678154-Pyramimonas_sp.AAC.1